MMANSELMPSMEKQGKSKRIAKERQSLELRWMGWKACTLTEVLSTEVN